MRSRPDFPVIDGRPAWWWIQLWRRCHELKWAGDHRAYWSRLGWPEAGAYEEQTELMIQVFDVITDVKAEILRNDLAKMRG